MATASAIDGMGLVPLAMGALGACIGTVLCFGWYRWLFRDALAKATEQLNALLQGVEQQMATQRLFQGDGEAGR